jgi:hypothetical protein
MMFLLIPEKCGARGVNSGRVKIIGMSLPSNIMILLG